MWIANVWYIHVDCHGVVCGIPLWNTVIWYISVDCHGVVFLCGIPWLVISQWIAMVWYIYISMDCHDGIYLCGI